MDSPVVNISFNLFLSVLIVLLLIDIFHLLDPIFQKSPMNSGCRFMSLCVHNAKNSGLAHRFFLIFCVKSGYIERWKVTDVFKRGSNNSYFNATVVTALCYAVKSKILPLFVIFFRHITCDETEQKENK